MPAATTHIECAKDIYERLPLGKQAIITNKNMFYLGSQGPDLFFFYKYGVMSRLKQIGIYMHEHRIEEIIKAMHEYIASSSDYDLLSYFYGYLCHYALDSSAHPLVFHRSKYGNLKDEPELVIHFRIEAFIDKYILNKKGRDISSYDTDKLVTISDTDITKLSKMYVSVFKSALGLTVEQHKIEKNCKQIVSILSYLKPSSLLKFKAIQAFENITSKGHTISSLMLYNDFDNIDYVLNNNHEEFKNINDDSLVYTDSFDDMYEKAILKGIDLINNPFKENSYYLDFEGKVQVNKQEVEIELLPE